MQGFGKPIIHVFLMKQNTLYICYFHATKVKRKKKNLLTVSECIGKYASSLVSGELSKIYQRS